MAHRLDVELSGVNNCHQGSKSPAAVDGNGYVAVQLVNPSIEYLHAVPSVDAL